MSIAAANLELTPTPMAVTRRVLANTMKQLFDGDTGEQLLREAGLVPGDIQQAGLALDVRKWRKLGNVRAWKYRGHIYVEQTLRGEFSRWGRIAERPKPSLVV